VMRASPTSHTCVASRSSDIRGTSCSVSPAAETRPFGLAPHGISHSASSGDAFDD
jgi:hypothetical protein